MLPEGPLDVPGSLEPQLRSLGMPIKLENGIVRFNTGYPLDAILPSDEALFSKHILHCRFYPAIIKLGGISKNKQKTFCFLRGFLSGIALERSGL